MTRIFGILFAVLALYAGVLISSENARSWIYQQTLAGWLGFYGILTVGVGILIISGGIDLSIGSVVGLGAVCLGLMLENKVNPFFAVAAVLVGSLFLGTIHGLLVTKLKLQPFLVTLCGLFIYRGLAKGAASISVGLGSDPITFQMKEFLVGGVGQGGRNQIFVLLLFAFFLGLLVHCTKHGRYLFAIGANEEAARYSGISTNWYKILSYVICSGMAGVGSVLYLLDNETANPTSAGSWLELFAITGAVLGGCSLRGGDGLVAGMVLGAAVLPLLRALCDFNSIGSDVQYAVIGFALLLGTIADELLKRRTNSRSN